ncbi:MAG: hypothetical protein ACI4QT_10910 [Kiritimatiellia bacterium]
MVRNVLFIFLFLAFPVFGASPLSSTRGLVSVLGNRLYEDNMPVRYACAAGVGLPYGIEEPEALETACQELAERLVRNGFNMVRIPDLVVPGGDAETREKERVQNFFILACKRNRIKIWAEVLYPVSVVPTPEQVMLMDDPKTHDEWTNAVVQASTDLNFGDIRLAAAWDHRIEILYQRRIRQWVQAFNGQTGLRRCEDPVYGLFSFTQFWWKDMTAKSRAALPGFFEQELADVWNRWLFNRYGSDEKIKEQFGGLADGESIETRSVAWQLEPAEKRRIEQSRFLNDLLGNHLNLLLTTFDTSGLVVMQAPRVVRYSASQSIQKYSTVRWMDSSALQKNLSKQEIPDDQPVVFNADDAATPEKAVEAVIRAVEAKASILALPCGNNPEAYADAARAFRAAADSASPPATAIRDYFSGEKAMLDLPGLSMGRSLKGMTNGLETLPFQEQKDGAPAGFPSNPRQAYPFYHPENRVVAVLFPSTSFSDPANIGALPKNPHQAFLSAEAVSIGLAVYYPEGKEGGGKAPDFRYSVWSNPSGDAISVQASLCDAETGEAIPFVMEVYGPGINKRRFLRLPAEGADRQAPVFPESGRYCVVAEQGACSLQFGDEVIRIGRNILAP